MTRDCEVREKRDSDVHDLLLGHDFDGTFDLGRRLGRLCRSERAFAGLTSGMLAVVLVPTALSGRGVWCGFRAAGRRTGDEKKKRPTVQATRKRCRGVAGLPAK
jgi:hypothetical protein